MLETIKSLITEKTNMLDVSSQFKDVEETCYLVQQIILHKQEMEVRNTETYKFMYDLLGAEVLNLFDMDQRIWKGEDE